MNIETWIQNNAHRVDWPGLRLRWDTMLSRYNPWRDDLHRVLVLASGLTQERDAVILDLGCGAGCTSEWFLRLFPKVKCIGVDCDPFLLAMAQFGLSDYVSRSQWILSDLRTGDWLSFVPDPIDIAVSHTALHWLSLENQQVLMKKIHSRLVPGGLFLNADPLCSSSVEMQKRLVSIRDGFLKHGEGEMWRDFWNSVQNEYELPQDLTERHDDYWEGTDDGYTREESIRILHEAGFSQVDLLWQTGTRAVIAALK